MAKIGFIGASGLMGHGMAKNLLAKGHAVTLTVHRNRERVADLLAAGATEAPDAKTLAANSDLVFLCVTGSPQVEANVLGTSGCAGWRQEGPVDRRLLDQRARFDGQAARRLRRRRRDLRRRAAVAHAGRSRGRAAERDDRRHARRRRMPEAGPAGLCRKRDPRRRAGARGTRSSCSTTSSRRRSAPPRPRPLRSASARVSTCSAWSS